MTLLCVVPLQRELNAFIPSLVEQGFASAVFSTGNVEAHQFPQLDLVVARGGHGKTQFGVQTQYLIDRIPNVDTVICLGTAGALAPELALGDVVLAAETIEHDYTQRFRRHPLPRFAGDADLIARLQHLSSHTLPFKIHVGIIASGDEDVIEIERAAVLRQATEACAVAWEGAGGARAARFNQLPFLELRGISDTADHQAASDFVANLQRTMLHLATLIILWRAA